MNNNIPPPNSGCSVNLSDNDNFLRPVNQRGVTSATGIMPLIDRWVNYNATSVVRTNGIEISATATEQGIFQILENPSLEGKAVTCACKYADGTLICVSGIVPPVQAYNQRFATTSENKGKAVVPAVQLLANTGYIQILLFSVCGGSDTICWAALYEGEYTADTLPPYVPRPYSVVLAECQRYYYQSWDRSNLATLNGMVVREAITEARLGGNITLPVEMRVTPTITFYNSRNGEPGIWTEWIALTPVSVLAIYNNPKSFIVAAQGNSANKFAKGLHYYGHYCASAEF